MTTFEERLAAAAMRVGDASLELLDWVEDNEAVVGAERGALLHEVFTTWHCARRLAAAAASEPTTVALVGPSRAGKTSLAAGLIERGAGALTVRFDGIREPINLMRQILPDTGRGISTAALRLSARPGSTPQNFPISLRLLGIADLVMLLASQQLDCTRGTARRRASADTHDTGGPLATAEMIAEERRIAESKLSAAVFPGLAEDDVWDIRLYIGGRFGDDPRVKALAAAGYWELLARTAPHLANEARARLLSLLWDGDATCTEVFRKLADALLTLGYGREASCALDALLGLDSRTGKLQRRNDSILGAGALTALDRADENTVVVRNQYAQWASLPRSVLAALATEIRLPIRDWPSTLLEQADILEMPSIDGATVATDATRAAAGDPPAIFGQRFLATKTAFLLERAIADHTITAMVVCMAPESRRVGRLADLVSRWVEQTHGADPLARENVDDGLLLALTKLDKLFVEPSKRGSERAIDWTRRITSTLRDAFGSHAPWVDAWTTTRTFDAVHLVRSPSARAKHLCEIAGNGREVAYKAGQLERIERARRGFLAASAVRRHVADPASVWREAFELNDGGTDLLLQTLIGVSEQRHRRRQLVQALETLRLRLRGQVQRFAASGDPTLSGEARRQRACMVARRLRRCAEDQRLAHLLSALQPGDLELRNVLAGHACSARTEAASQDSGNGARSADVVQLEVSAAAVNGRGDGGVDRPIDRSVDGHAKNSEAMGLARAALVHWIGSLRTVVDGHDADASLRMPRKALDGLVDELIRGATRRDLERTLAERIARAIDSGNPGDTGYADDDPLSRAALFAAGAVGDFVMRLGFDDSLSNTHPRRKGRNQQPIFPARAAVDLDALDEDEPEETIDHAFLADWTQAFMTLVGENVEHDRATALDCEQRKRLDDVLQLLDSPL